MVHSIWCCPEKKAAVAHVSGPSGIALRSVKLGLPALYGILRYPLLYKAPSQNKAQIILKSALFWPSFGIGGRYRRESLRSLWPQDGLSFG